MAAPAADITLNILDIQGPGVGKASSGEDEIGRTSVMSHGSDRDSVLELNADAMNAFDADLDPRVDAGTFEHMDQDSTADEVTPSNPESMLQVLAESRATAGALPEAPQELLAQHGETYPRRSYIAQDLNPASYGSFKGGRRGSIGIPGESGLKSNPARRQSHAAPARRLSLSGHSNHSDTSRRGSISRRSSQNLSGLSLFRPATPAEPSTASLDLDSLDEDAVIDAAAEAAAAAMGFPLKEEELGAPTHQPPGRPAAPQRRRSSLMGLSLPSLRSLAGVSRREVGTEVRLRDVSNREYLTHGAMCNIFKARYENQMVIIKVPRNDAPKTAANDLELEIVLLKELAHPNIGAIVMAGKTSSGMPFLGLEPLMGGNLSEVVQNMGVFTHWSQGLHYARDITAAMAFLHEEAIPGHCVIHRDLKPDNICFTDDMTLKVVDFGLAKVVRRKYSNLSEAYTMTAHTGSLRYMAPEVGLAKPYNEKVDVYAWAMICWFGMTRKLPFASVGVRDFKTQVFKGTTRPELDDSWPLEVQQLLQDSWSHNFQERPSFKVILESLDAMIKNLLAQSGGCSCTVS